MLLKKSLTNLFFAVTEGRLLLLRYACKFENNDIKITSQHGN